MCGNDEVKHMLYSGLNLNKPNLISYWNRHHWYIAYHVDWSSNSSKNTINSAVRFKRSGRFGLLQDLPTVLIHTYPNISRKKSRCINTYLCFCARVIKNGNGIVTNQLRLSKIPPAKKRENSSVDWNGETDGKKNRLSVSVALQSVTCTLCVCVWVGMCVQHMGTIPAS